MAKPLQAVIEHLELRDVTEGMGNKPALWKNSPAITYFKYLVLFQYLGLKSYFT